MSALSSLLWWKEKPVNEPRPMLTSEEDRAERERDAKRLKALMDLVDAEIDALRNRIPGNANLGD